MIRKIICQLSVLLVLAPFACGVKAQAETVAVPQPVVNQYAQEAKTDLLNNGQNPLRGAQTELPKPLQSAVAKSLVAPTTTGLSPQSTASSKTEPQASNAQQEAQRDKAANALAVARDYTRTPDEVLHDGSQSRKNSQTQLPQEFQSLPDHNLEAVNQDSNTNSSSISTGSSINTATQVSDNLSSRTLASKMEPEDKEGTVPSGVSSVKNWDEFKAAVSDNKIGTINFEQDISATSNYSDNKQRTASLTINGQGHSLNLGSYSCTFSADVAAKTTRTFKLMNSTVNQSTNINGVFSVSGSTKNNDSTRGIGQIVFDNVNYTGQRMATAQNYDLIFKNKINITTVKEIATITNVWVSPESQVKASSSGVDGAFWFYNSGLATPYGNLNIENGTATSPTTFNFTKQGGGSSLLYAVHNLNIGNYTNVNLDGGTSTGIINTGATGDLTVGSDSNVDLRSSTGSVINFGSSNGNVTIGERSTVQLSNLDSKGVNSTTNTNTILNMNQNLYLSKDAKLKIIGSNSNNPAAISLSSSTSKMDTIFLDERSDLDIYIPGNLGNGLFNSPIVSNKGSATLDIKSNASFVVDATHTKTSVNVKILDFGSNSNVNVDHGTLNIKTNMNMGISGSLIDCGGNATFNLINPKLFNLEYTDTNTTAPIMNLSGTKNILNISSSDTSFNDVFTVYSQKNDYNWAYRNIATDNTTSAGSIYLGVNGNTGISEPDNITDHFSNPNNTISLTKTKMKSTPNNKIATDSFLLNFNPANYRKLKIVPHSEGAPDYENVKVDNWKDFYNAMRSPMVNYIKVDSDFAYDRSNGTPGDAANYVPLRNLVVDGKKDTVSTGDSAYHSIDFIYAHFENPVSVPLGFNIKFEFSDLNLFGTGYWGPFTSYNSYSALTSPKYGVGTMKYDNINYTGSQLTCSYNFAIEFAGKIINKSVKSEGYISPIDGTRRTGDQLIYAEENIEAAKLTFLNDCDYYGSGVDTSVFNIKQGGGIYIGDNSKVEVEGIVKSAPSIPNGIVYTESDFTIGNNASFTIKPPKSLGCNALVVNGSNISIGGHSSFNINLNESNSFTPNDNSLITTKSTSLTKEYPSISVADYGELNITGSTQRKTSSSKYSDANSLINTSGNFKIGTHGTLNIALKDGFPADSKDKGSSLSGISLIYGNTTNGKFSFDDAELVNLDISENAADAKILNMANNSVFEARNQTLRAWWNDKTGKPIEEGAIQRDPDWPGAPADQDYFYWPYVVYLKQIFPGTKNISSSTITSTQGEDLSKYYNPDNFKHLQFTHVPDVDISMDKLSSGSSSIKGKAFNRDSEITIKYYPITSQDPSGVLPKADNPISDKDFVGNKDYQYYHLKPDIDGNYEVKLNDGAKIHPGDRFVARAYLHGKEAFATQTVQGKIDVIGGDKDPNTGKEDPDKDISPDKGKINSDDTIKDGQNKNLATEASDFGINYVSNFTFKSAKLDANVTNQNVSLSTKKPMIQVNDFRQGKYGWQVQASLSPFTNVNDPSKSIAGARLLLKSGGFVKRNNNSNADVKDIPPTFAGGTDGVTLTPSTDSQFTNVLTAKNTDSAPDPDHPSEKDFGKGVGKGIWKDLFTGSVLQFNPTLVASGNYQATVTWQLVNGPTD
ncbi:WxL domain-containing protein [Lactobacillus sp. DCY120]|uniref:WxL domain-containing protein n=1 Tax=Bombilactobacillus apium TaxID=2675299 RepID=A0A850R6M8_9LACO|nr:pectate lyase-like adhesive domain-containing protein [Bombilactobacillus apium]NVY96477.1 WxL domain-containing protein [Bombilactobacillus apium]